MPRTSAVVALCVASLVALSACDVEATDAPLEASGDPVSFVAYGFETDWEGAALTDGRRTWTTALGYEVELEQWTLLTTSVELIPCTYVDGRQFVFAHGTYEHNLSVAEARHQDDLIAGAAWPLGMGVVSDPSYCRAFTVHGTGVGDEVATMSGRYRAPGATEWVSFSARNPLGLTSLANLTQPFADADLGAATASLTIVRYPVRAFDTLALDALSQLDLAYSATQALVRDVDVYLGVPTN